MTHFAVGHPVMQSPLLLGKVRAGEARQTPKGCPAPGTLVELAGVETSNVIDSTVLIHDILLSSSILLRNVKALLPRY